MVVPGGGEFDFAHSGPRLGRRGDRKEENGVATRARLRLVYEMKIFNVTLDVLNVGKSFRVLIKN